MYLFLASYKLFLVLDVLCIVPTAIMIEVIPIEKNNTFVLVKNQITSIIKGEKKRIL